MKKLLSILMMALILLGFSAHAEGNVAITKCIQNIQTDCIDISVSAPDSATGITIILSRRPMTDFVNMESAQSSIISFVQQEVTGRAMNISVGYNSNEPEITQTVYAYVSCGGQYIASSSTQLKTKEAYITDEFKNASAWNSYSGFISTYNTAFGMFSLTDAQARTLSTFNDVETAEVYKKMFLLRNTFAQVSDIEASYTTSIAQVAQAKSNASQNTTTQGGGGGGGAFYVQPVEPEVVNGEPQQPQTTDSRFIDLNEAQWAKEAIEYLCANGIINGVSDKEFNPSGELTREDFVTMFARAAKLQPEADIIEFEDVTPGSYYASCVTAAVEKGIILGVGDGRFGTGQKLKRQDLALILYRAFYDGETKTVKSTDWDEISDYAQNAVGVLMEKGIVNGMDDGSFAPMQNSTRAQAAQLIYNLINKRLI